MKHINIAIVHIGWECVPNLSKVRGARLDHVWLNWAPIDKGDLEITLGLSVNAQDQMHFFFTM